MTAARRLTRRATAASIALFAVACVPPGGHVPPAPDPAAVVQTPAGLAPTSVARDWWVAFTLGDTAYVSRRSAPELRLTLSNGRTYDHAAAMGLTRVQTGRNITMQWTDSAVLHTGPGHAVTTHRVTEAGLNGLAQTYRYMTVLAAHDGTWRVVAAQSTRELAPAPAVEPDVSGQLADFAGSYRGARGGVVKIEVRDRGLAMVEPGGASYALEPAGPGLFQLDLRPGGGAVVQFLFARSSTGQVASLSRLLNGYVTTWVRVD